MSNTDKRNLMKYYVARTLTQFAASMFQIALPLYILELTNSLAVSGTFFALMNIPGVVLVPVIGILIEKKDKKKSSMVFLAVIILLHCLSGIFRLYRKIGMLFVFAVTVQVFLSGFDIATKVLFSVIVTKENIERENGLKSFLDNASVSIAPVLGTVLYGILGFDILLGINIIIYLISVLILSGIYVRQHNGSINEPEKWLKMLKEGFLFIFNRKDIICLCSLTMALNFFVANSDEIIYPGILIKRFSIDSALYGITSTAAIIGTLAAGLFVYKMKLRLSEKLPTLFRLNSWIMISIGCCALMFPVGRRNLYFMIFVVLQFVLGFVTTCINIPLISYFQINVPIEYQGRFFSATSCASQIVISFGIAYAGLLAEKLGAGITFIINNVIVLLIVGYVTPIYRVVLKRD